MVYVPNTETVMFPRYDVAKHLDGKHDQAAHGRKGAIPAGYNNWNSKVETLIASAENLDSSRGNAVQATFIEAAGFNGKPQILSQKDFDALEGETIYRAVSEEWQVKDFQESLVQYGGEGVFGNGTYSTNTRESATFYAGDNGNKKDIIDSRTMEMKLLPEANVITFDDAFKLKEYSSDLSNKFVEQYKAFGKNPAEVLEVQWQLANDNDWTNIAIMNGVDAVRFKPIDGEGKTEYYTIILNRGKVAMNGKS
jgi:hypothetical protein